MYSYEPHSSTFIAIQASASRPAIRPSNKSTSRCTRRHALRFAAFSLISAAVGSQITAAQSAEISDTVTSDDFETIRASVKDDASLADFVALLQKGGVKQVWFFGTFKEYCCFEDSDGVLHHIEEGYPVESSRSPESPLHVMAKVRDSNVPYSVAPLSAKYLRR